MKGEANMSENYNDKNIKKNTGIGKCSARA